MLSIDDLFMLWVKPLLDNGHSKDTLLIKTQRVHECNGRKLDINGLLLKVAA